MTTELKRRSPEATEAYFEGYRAAIERCAQVAQRAGDEWSNDAKAISEIAAAIRKLKDAL